MDIYSNRIPDSFRLIKGLFFIILLSGLVGATMFFSLNIRDTAEVSGGEIFSQNSPKQYNAPFEAEVESIHIKEGGKVMAGDTLIVLYNETLQADYNNLQKELDLKRENTSLLKRKFENLNSKIKIQEKEVTFVSTDVESQRKGLELELRALAKQLNVLKEQLKTSESRIIKDRKLFRRGSISEKEFNSKNKAYLEEKNYFTELESKYFQKRNTFRNMDNTRSSSIEKKNLDIISSESQLLDLQKTLAQEEGAILKLKRQIKSAKKELDKLTIISEMNGFTSGVFNVKRNFNFVSKGQSLVVVAPSEEVDFLAKLIVNEKEMKDIMIGQKVRLKVDAYNHYQYGLLEGEVIQINKDELNKFYVIADIEEGNEKFDLKSGYKVKGEIVLDRVRLYKYAFNKIFKKL